jgi:hypothetical protein
MDDQRAVSIWNRACSKQPGTSVGDQHLFALLSVHSIIMNGGTDHSRDVFDSDDFEAAVAGAEYLGLDEAAGLIRRIATNAASAGVENSEYFSRVRDDAIYAAFHRRLASSPQDFQDLASSSRSLTS